VFPDAWKQGADCAGVDGVDGEEEGVLLRAIVISHVLDFALRIVAFFG
jgi:hypothetical protein